MSKTRTIALAAVVAFLLLILAAPPGGAPAMAAGEPAAQNETALAPHYSEEADPNLGYLFAVYIVTWAGFFGYVFWISTRQRTMAREIKYLKRLLDAQRDAQSAQVDTDG